MTSKQRSAGHTWALPVGLLMVVLGVFAVARPVFASVASSVFFGVLFLAGAVVQAIHAFRTHGAGPFFLRALVAVLYGVAGIYLVESPLEGAAALVLALGLLFVLKGILRIALALSMRRYSTWGYMLTNGILSLGLGVLLWAGWPSNALWVIGLLVGVGLVFDGVALIAFYFGERALVGRSRSPA